MNHLPVLIKDLALILGAAGIVTLLFRKMKQPVVLGYILAGFIVGPSFPLFPTITETQSIKIWADIGVIFLLFGLGLQFSFKKLFRVGGTALVTSVIEISSLFILGYSAGHYFFGWNNINSLFLGGILSISSTTIIIRAFNELGIKNQKFANNVFGVLIFEDLVAIVLLVLLSAVSIGQQLEGLDMAVYIAKLGFFLTIWFLGGIFLIPTFFKKTKSLMNEETIMIVSLGFCLVMVIVASSSGFSPALGAFIMGSILAETPEAEKIVRTTKPVKNLFGAIFFVSVGMLLDPVILSTYWAEILGLTLLLIFGKTISVTTGALIAGQPLKISVQMGMSLSQIGEFSFIIAGLGLSLGVVNEALYPMAVAVSALTTFTTPYMIKSSDSVYRRLESLLPKPWIDQLDRYSSGAQTIAAVDDWRLLLRSYVWRVGGNSVIIIAIFLSVIRFATPFIYERFEQDLLAAIIAISAALTVAAPFLWALAIGRSHKKSFQHLWKQRKYRGPIIILELSRIYIAILLVSLLLIQFTPSLWAVIIPIVLMGSGLIVFRKRLQTAYHLIENRFLLNLNLRNDKDMQNAPTLAPWDAHIVNFDVDPYAPCIGKSLLELSVREKYGVTVALIQRGHQRITAPGRDIQVFPNDRLAVIGTDEQLEKFKELVMSPSQDNEPSLTDYSLQKVILRTNSPYISKTIRDSGLREATQGLVVGIERRGQRILNPDSNMVFEPEDLVWIVGDPEKIGSP